ncbi:MAG: hypothetical protein HZA95_00810 [Candidatus Vogelbacteria bacterium]|nr:hypothetical protein [Candidatus Vogelbacteria bacterium]
MINSSSHSYKVDILDEHGKPVETKVWNEVDRRKDYLENAFVFVFTQNREMLLATLTESKLSKKIYKGKMGVPAVSLVWQNEDPSKAAERALLHDMCIHPSKLYLLGREFESLKDGTKRLMNVFYCLYDNNWNINTEQLSTIKKIKRVELETLLKIDPDQFSPQFLVAYEKYKRKFPY